MKGGPAKRQLFFFSVSLAVHLVVILVLIPAFLFVPDGTGVVVDRPLIVDMRAEGIERTGVVGEGDADRRERTVGEPVAPGRAPSTGGGQEIPLDIAATGGGAPLSPRSGPSGVIGGGGGGDEALSEYVSAIRRLIERHKNYPRDAYLRAEEGTVTVSFLLDARGDLLDAGVSESSGHPVLDEAAVRAIRNASPYPIFPDELGRDTLTLRLSIRYEIR